MKYLFFLSIFCPIFLDTNLIYILGLGENRTTIAYIPMTFIILLEIIKKQIYINKSELLIIIWGIISFFLKLSIDQGDVFKRYLTFFILPFLFINYLDKISKRQRKILQKIIFSFLIIECSMAVFERATFTTLLDNNSYNIMNEEMAWTFRSSALLGHPLGNAMAVSVVNIFILCSQLNNKTKISYYIIAMISLICFNERGNIIISFLASIPPLYSLYKNESVYHKKLITYILIPLSCIFIYFLSITDLGGRLFNINHTQDGSSFARIEALKSLLYLSPQNLLLGNPNNYEYLLNRMNLAGIENGIITLLIYHGLIIGVPAILLLLTFHYRKLNIAYLPLQKWLILITFYGIGVTNPHISNPYQWFLFICAYYAFRPINKKIPSKYEKSITTLRRM